MVVPTKIYYSMPVWYDCVLLLINQTVEPLYIARSLRNDFIERWLIISA